MRLSTDLVLIGVAHSFHISPHLFLWLPANEEPASTSFEWSTFIAGDDAVISRQLLLYLLMALTIALTSLVEVSLRAYSSLSGLPMLTPL